MGSSYQTVLATGELDAVRAAVAESGLEAVVLAVAEHRWAVVPSSPEGYAETDTLGRLLSRAPGSVAATFEVLDSVVLVAGLFRAGRAYHDYLSDQAYVETEEDDDGTEIFFDALGRTYPPGAVVPTGPYGADPAAFAPLGAGVVDETKLGAALSAESGPADDRHRDVLSALNLDPDPLQMSYEDALASGRAV